MDINLLGTDAINTTMTQAKFAKKTEELEKFSKALNEAKNTNDVQDDKELMDMCKEFEQYFIKEMYKSMKNTINHDGFIEYSQGEEIFSDLLDDEYAKAATESGSVGLAKMLYNQLKKQN